MSTLELQQLWHEELRGVSGQLTAGTYVVLASVADGANTLLELSGGLAFPTFGSVLLEGEWPYATPALRRRIGALLAKEQLPPAQRVHQAVRAALRARSDARSAQAVLESAGLSWLSARRVRALSARETRAVLLSLALSLEQPLLLALFEPHSLLGLVSETYLRDSMARAASAGAVVLTSVSRLEDAAQIAGALSVLDRGSWLPASTLRTPLESAALRVHATESARLVSALAGSSAIQSVESSGATEFVVRGPALEPLAAHVLERARESDVVIQAMGPELPSLDALAKARAGAAQAAYERARVYATRPIFYGPGPEP